MKHNRINSRQCFSLPEDKTNHDDSNNHDDNIIDDNTIILDDICVLKEHFDSYQVKCMKKLQNVKDAFLRKTIRYGAKVRKKISERRYDEKYERLLNQLEKENFLLKDEMRRKDKVVNILFENF